MSVLHRSMLRLLVAVLAAATPLAAQTRFPHQAHAGLFPLCQGCHDVRSAEPSAHYPSPQLCARCHDGRMEPRVSWSAPATPGFPHPVHPPGAGVRASCTDCHGQGGGTVVDAAQPACEQCHARHHQLASRCRLCHVPPPRSAHDASAHGGCAGSGCHAADRVSGLAFTRQLCLLCHPKRTDHFPGQRCSDCHPVGPEPGAAGAGSGVPATRPGAGR